MKCLPLLLFGLAASISVVPRAIAATTIPFIGCIEQGPTPNDGSWTAPSGKPLTTNLPPALADRLALYASNWSAVLAPRGWACRSAVIEQRGVAMIVSPEPAEGDDRGILAGPAVILWNDQSSDAVAAYAVHYFPGAIAAPGRVPRDMAPRFRADIIRRETPSILSNTTPANHRGLGNQIGTPATGQAALADQGLLALSNRKRGEGGVVNLTVRLPASLTSLDAPIIAEFRACLPNNNTVACESGHSFTAQGRPIDDGD